MEIIIISGESATDKTDSIGEPLGAAELNHTVTSLLMSGEAEIAAGMSEPPKAEHQKATAKETSVSKMQTRQSFREKEEKQK